MAPQIVQDVGTGWPDSPPGAGYTVTLRIVSPARPTLLPGLAATVATVGAVVVGMDLVEAAPSGTTVDITLQARDAAQVSLVSEALVGDGCLIRHTSDRAFLYHLGGKLEITPRVTMRTRQDLALAYTPGVARIAAAIASQPDYAQSLTGKANLVAIITDGTAVLGLGPIGPLAALPVMEGKALLFKQFGHVNAFPLCLDTQGVDDLVHVATALAPGFGAINLEDISAPNCFEVESRLQNALNIPVFHDDQHGTAIVVLAGLLNACRLTGRTLSGLRIVQVGCGAAGTAIAHNLLDSGVTDLTVFDREGAVSDEVGWPSHHRGVAARSNSRSVQDLPQALAGADVFIGTAQRGSVEPDWLYAMAKRPIVFALANPDPDVDVDQLRADTVLATGRSDLPNQINNSLCFPGFFRGALEAGATRVTTGMKTQAALAIAACVSPAELDLGVLVPSMFCERVHDAVAEAVSQAWNNRHDLGECQSSLDTSGARL